MLLCLLCVKGLGVSSLQQQQLPQPLLLLRLQSLGNNGLPSCPLLPRLIQWQQRGGPLAAVSLKAHHLLPPGGPPASATKGKMQRKGPQATNVSLLLLLGLLPSAAPCQGLLLLLLLQPGEPQGDAEGPPWLRDNKKRQKTLLNTRQRLPGGMPPEAPKNRSPEAAKGAATTAG